MALAGFRLGNRLRRPLCAENRLSERVGPEACSSQPLRLAAKGAQSPTYGLRSKSGLPPSTSIPATRSFPSDRPTLRSRTADSPMALGRHGGGVAKSPRSLPELREDLRCYSAKEGGRGAKPPSAAPRSAPWQMRVPALQSKPRWLERPVGLEADAGYRLSLIHISEPTRPY